MNKDDLISQFDSLKEGMEPVNTTESKFRKPLKKRVIKLSLKVTNHFVKDFRKKTDDMTIEERNEFIVNAIKSKL